MKNCYVNSVGCVSSQNTVDNNQFLDEISIYDSNVIEIIKPNYKEYIQGASARRMTKGVKMGVVSSAIALKEANIASPDAIITGTGMGCVIDSEKFVSAIIDNDEEFLTPTSFIQSTHNTVGAQIALGIKCKSYNFTYVHSAISFESCLIDAQLMINEGEAAAILVGGVDELGAHTTKLHQLAHHIKEETINSLELLESNTKGSVFGEGASFFVLSDSLQENSYAELKDVTTFNELPLENLEQSILKFLKANNVALNDIDSVILGKNGNIEFDHYYSKLQQGIFNQTPQIAYKHLSGEYNTASSFGFWVASKILKEQQVPNVLKLNDFTKNSFKNILLYNQYRGENHSFILLSAC